jgi:serine/threonine protein phosphatase PrpC
MGSQYESRESRRDGRRQGDTTRRVRAAALSDPGCERESNEDRFLLFAREDLAGYFVFDGMGGQPAGEAAAEISSAVVHDALRGFEGGDLKLFITRAIESAQEEILSRSRNSDAAGMGTTVVGVLIRANEVIVASVGDSRAYHIRRGAISQITCDHTLVQKLVDAGQISPQEALTHPQSHILTRCLGSTLEFGIDLKHFQIRAKSQINQDQDYLLLCSDGLYSVVSDEEMGAVVFNFDPQEATSKLIEIALSRGGPDNITAMVVPLRGCLVEPDTRITTTTDFWHKPEDVPDSPDDLDRGSRFKEQSGIHGNRVQFWQYVGAVIILSALALIFSVVGFAFFTMK